MILCRRQGADPLDILHHREPKRVRIDAGVATVIKFRLEHDIGVGAQELHHRAVGQQSLFMQPVHDRVVRIGRAAFIHHLGLRLRIEILRNDANDAQNFTLPRAQAGARSSP